MSEKLSKVPTLYTLSLKYLVQQMDMTVKSLEKISHLRLLPPSLQFDLYLEVSYNLSSSLTWRLFKRYETKTFDKRTKRKKINFHFSTK